MAIDNLEIARMYTDKFNQHDADGCAALAAEDGKFTDVVLGMDSEGPSGLRAWTQLWLTAFPDANVEVVNAVASGDTVVTESIFRGTQRGPLVTPMGSIPPTGRQVEGYACTVTRYRDGKLVSGRQYYDGLALLRQLGVAPSLAAAPEAHPQP